MLLLSLALLPTKISITQSGSPARTLSPFFGHPEAMAQLKDKQENLHSRLEQYDSEEHENEHVHKRNLQTFAEVNKYIEDILNYIKEPDAKPQGLLMKLVKDKL